MQVHPLPSDLAHPRAGLNLSCSGARRQSRSRSSSPSSQSRSRFRSSSGSIPRQSVSLTGSSSNAGQSVSYTGSQSFAESDVEILLGGRDERPVRMWLLPGKKDSSVMSLRVTLREYVALPRNEERQIMSLGSLQHRVSPVRLGLVWQGPYVIIAMRTLAL